MRCMSCGNENPPGSRFCDRCGRAVPSGVAAAPSAPLRSGPPSAHQQQSSSTNGLAIASMVLGIVWLYWIGSVLAVLFGHVALSQINRDGQQGRGFAIAGLALGWVGVGTLMVFLLVAVAAT